MHVYLSMKLCHNSALLLLIRLLFMSIQTKIVKLLKKCFNCLAKQIIYKTVCCPIHLYHIVPKHGFPSRIVTSPFQPFRRCQKKKYALWPLEFIKYVRQLHTLTNTYVEVILISILGNQHQTLCMFGYNQVTHLQNLWYMVEHDGKTVTGWYCQCPIGTRIVGCCSHIASVIWFLAYARHQGYKPKGDKISPLLMDAAQE